jgi:hypothetical protein
VVVKIIDDLIPDVLDDQIGSVHPLSAQEAAGDNGGKGRKVLALVYRMNIPTSTAFPFEDTVRF